MLHCNGRLRAIFTKCRPAAFRMSRKSSLLRTAHCCRSRPPQDAAARPVEPDFRCNRTISDGRIHAMRTKRKIVVQVQGDAKPQISEPRAKLARCF